MGRRVDVVLLVGGVVFVVEFKVGAAAYDSSSLDQCWDYALDLKNFHAASHDLPIVPMKQFLGFACSSDPPTPSFAITRSTEGSCWRSLGRR